MSRVVVAGLLLLGVFAGSAPAAPPPADVALDDPWARVGHHLKAVDGLTHHFESVLDSACPRFDSPRQWKQYLDGEVDRIVLLLAHLEAAWEEAKRTGDDDLRRSAKAPRRRIEQARTLLDKLQTCAGDNGQSFSPVALWRRIERDVPKRQAEIALPEP